jgi:hypothetical protein
MARVASAEQVRSGPRPYRSAAGGLRSPLPPEVAGGALRSRQASTIARRLPSRAASAYRNALHPRRPYAAAALAAPPRLTPTSERLVAAAPDAGLEAGWARPERAASRVRRGDLVLGRLDVLQSLDGVEPGIWELRRLEMASVRVLNRAAALLASHDKLASGLAFGRAGLPTRAQPRSTATAGTRPSSRPSSSSRGSEAGAATYTCVVRPAAETLSAVVEGAHLVPSARRPRPGAHSSARTRPQVDRRRAQGGGCDRARGGARRVANERGARRAPAARRPSARGL